MGYHGTAFHADAGYHAPQKAERNIGLITRFEVPAVGKPVSVAEAFR